MKLAFVACLALSCAPAAPRGSVFPVAVLDAPADPEHALAVAQGDAREAWIARAQRYEDATGDLSAVVSVSVRDLERGQGFESRGAIAVRRPDAMRMQMSGPGGVTAVDLLARGGTYWSRIAGRPWTHGALSDPPAPGFPASTIARVFLGFDWAHADVLHTGALGLLRVPSPDGFALVTMDAADGALREVRWFTSAGERSRVRFAEFDTDEHGTRFPRVVVFWQAHPDVTSTIAVEHRTVHPTLPTATFTPPEGA